MIANLPDGNSPLSAYEIFAEVDFIVTDLDGTLIAGDFPVLKQIKDSSLRVKKKTNTNYCRNWKNLLWR